MLYLLVWILIGAFMMWLAAFIHLKTAEQKGYKALEWWFNNINQLLDDDDQKYFGIRFGFGLVIWPVRFIQFTLDLKYYYSVYDVYED